MSADDAAKQPSVRELFLAALEEESPAAREAYLSASCGGDTARRAKVEALLRSHREDDFLEHPAVAGAGAGASGIPGERPGMRIGRYQILERIGEGGCGVVYLAEQQEPVRRRVALKIIKLGMDTRGFIARFEAERQALALMDHANIAKVFDAGATETGRPFLVMELVKGVKITEFCDQRQLPTAGRLELFTRVCQAVQHAHQKGVVHRDLKPSNVLVTPPEDPAAAACPKIIDFGIAKATAGQRLTEHTVSTAFEPFVGTPAYMSPEQAGLSPAGAGDIDTRSDIYSLGVLLYELLTGKTPFDTQELWQEGLEGMRRTLRDKEPVRPSTRLETMHAAEMRLAAHHRQAEPPRLIHLVRGDLDWIVMKALEKDRTRRYETANDLAGDILRHLNHEPVLARPPSRAYRLRKLVRRNRIAFAAGGAVLAALLIGLAVAGWGLVRERAARSRAEISERTAAAESVKAAEVSRFLKEMLLSVQPSVALGRDTTLLRGLLDTTAARVTRDLTNQPAVGAELRATLGGTYDALGDYARAEALHREALATRRKLFGNDHLQVAESMHLLASALYHQRQAAEAETLFRQALVIRRKLLGTAHPQIAESLNNLALALNFQQKFKEAEPLQKEALTLQQTLLGPDHPDVATSLHNLAAALTSQRQFAEAEPLFRQALALFEKQRGEANPEVSAVLHNLAFVLLQLRRADEAETILREVLRVKQQQLGPNHPEVGASLRNLAWALHQQGKSSAAEQTFRDALASARRGATNSPVDLESCLFDLASALLERASITTRPAATVSNQPQPVREHANQPALPQEVAREAEGLLREYLLRRGLNTNDWRAANVKSHLGRALTIVAATDPRLSATQREAILVEGQSHLLSAHARLQASRSAASKPKREAYLHLVRLYEVWPKPEAALDWKKQLARFDEKAGPSATR